MKLFAAFVLVLSVWGLWMGCSDSTTPINTHPLLLTIVSDSSYANSALFNFRVTRNGAPLKGARLQRTDSPILTTFDLGITSDTGGYFPRVTVVIPLTQDTMNAVAYQAVSGDSLTSNYFTWP